MAKFGLVHLSLSKLVSRLTMHQKKLMKDHEAHVRRGCSESLGNLETIFLRTNLETLTAWISSIESRFLLQRNWQSLQFTCFREVDLITSDIHDLEAPISIWFNSICRKKISSQVSKFEILDWVVWTWNGYACIYY